jgi:metallophosphoesterase superfamily enzyme
MRENKCSELIVLGDAKHDAKGFHEREKLVVREFIDSLDCEKIVVTKGNHDSRLEELEPVCEKLFVTPATGFTERILGKKFGFFHGHAWPLPEFWECDCILQGNSHPGIELRHGTGIKEFKSVVPAWVIGYSHPPAESNGKKKIKTIFVPAFSKLVGATAMNSEERQLGVLLKNNLFDLKSAKAYSLEGIPLGKVFS